MKIYHSFFNVSKFAKRGHIIYIYIYVIGSTLETQPCAELQLWFESRGKGTENNC